MWTDLSSLSWVQWKHARSEGIYWLRVLGWDPTSSGFYRIYFLGFWVFWVFTMWRYVVDQVSRISIAVQDDVILGLTRDTPTVLFIAFVLYLIVTLRRSPLQLTAPEMALVVASPIRRGALVIAHFVKKAIIPAFIVGLVSAQYAMLLTWTGDGSAAGIAGLVALLIAVPLVLINAALAWSLSLLRVQPEARRWSRFLWLILPVIALIYLTIPDLALWTGRLWAAALVPGALTAVHAILILAAMIGSFALLWWVGERVHLSLVSDASRTFARIYSLGLLGRLYAQELVEQVQRQERLMRKKTLRLTLPDGDENILRSRALLSLWRLSPTSLIYPILRGASTAALFMGVIIFSGGSAAQTWLLILLLCLFMRPKELVAGFRQDIGQVFMSQMIRQDNLVRYFASQAFPLFLVSFGALAVFVLNPLTDLIVGGVAIVLVILGLGIAQALEIVEDGTVIFRPIPYEYTVLIAGGLSIGAGLLFQSLIAGLIVLMLAELIFFGILSSSRT